LSKICRKYRRLFFFRTRCICTSTNYVRLTVHQQQLWNELYTPSQKCRCYMATWAGQQLPALNLWLSENVSPIRKFSSKNTKFGATTHIWGKFNGKVGILSIYNLLCWKMHCLLEFCQKFSTSCPTYFFNAIGSGNNWHHYGKCNWGCKYWHKESKVST